ncbi:hypothetical protein FVEG_15435 [Fusarium verticillioides 7600]|uniref:Uncharacterized protein n=1 Tax=Gibberella moniliformis (strain M3125 / FGSC 7600) TaxID=334819 RepID=W7M4F6_GIBM7|nr:hypothetical protein FVEG_15435 [Fusarium verticillioides 7600]XP_018748626.1 hypothetical protein FVEG_15435 [Fusarium verticillioides 7600]EWG42434.1 hypothetical protein FVEG_15435 [Fusarium verticillioides 7600]EWG42435.1 hypothetical protein FVEG_15435 [Fusarium verticillioides 7600]
MRTHDSILCSPTHERNFVPPSTAWSTPHSHPQLPLPTMIRPPTFSVKLRLPAHGGVRLLISTYLSKSLTRKVPYQGEQRKLRTLILNDTKT